jgi:hypothetical protein
MDSLDTLAFENVSINEAKDALDHFCVGPRPTMARQKDMHTINQEIAVQRLPNQGPVKLDESAYRWIMLIPEATRPIVLAQQFPRVLNHIIELWKRPLKCDDYLESLLIDQRGNRRGFPDDVTEELAKLKEYFELNYAHTFHSVWGDRIGDDISRFRK